MSNIRVTRLMVFFDGLFKKYGDDLTEEIARKEYWFNYCSEQYRRREIKRAAFYRAWKKNMNGGSEVKSNKIWQFLLDVEEGYPPAGIFTMVIDEFLDYF